MADDYQDLGGLEVFPFRPNWLTRPSTSHVYARRLLSQAGTVKRLASLTDWAPDVWEASFQVDNKDDEYDLLDFFYDRRGKHGRFWVEHPASAFVLESDILSGAVEIPCEANKSDIAWQGNERIYIEMADGDVLTRKVGTIDYSEANDRVELNLTTALDRDLTSANHNMIGKFLLARFASDGIELAHESIDVFRVKLRFYELVEEYDDV